MQEQTSEMLKPDTALEGGKVRPKSKVKIKFLNSAYHNVPFVIEEVHPSLAEKLVAQGKAAYDTKITAEEKKLNKAHLERKIKEKGRKPGKTKAEAKAEDESNELDSLEDIA